MHSYSMNSNGTRDSLSQSSLSFNSSPPESSSLYNNFYYSSNNSSITNSSMSNNYQYSNQPISNYQYDSNYASYYPNDTSSYDSRYYNNYSNSTQYSYYNSYNPSPASSYNPYVASAHSSSSFYNGSYSERSTTSATNVDQNEESNPTIQSTPIIQISTYPYELNFDTSKLENNTDNNKQAAINKNKKARNILEELDDQYLLDNINTNSSKHRTRTAFTTEQRRYLLSIFEKTCYPSREALEIASNQLNVSISKIQIWFKNTRSKQKKLTKQ